MDASPAVFLKSGFFGVFGFSVGRTRALPGRAGRAFRSSPAASTTFRAARVASALVTFTTVPSALCTTRGPRVRVTEAFATPAAVGGFGTPVGMRERVGGVFLVWIVLHTEHCRRHASSKMAVFAQSLHW
jgi:hypothetical protein